MRSRNQIQRKSERGQSVVEIAVCFPVFILIVMGLISCGWLYHHQLVLNHAIREAARRGAVGATDAQIGAVIQDKCVGLDPSQLQWTITPPDTSEERVTDSTLTIEIQYNDKVPMPIIGSLVGPKVLRARSDILIEIYPAM